MEGFGENSRPLTASDDPEGTATMTRAANLWMISSRAVEQDALPSAGRTAVLGKSESPANKWHAPPGRKPHAVTRASDDRPIRAYTCTVSVTVAMKVAFTWQYPYTGMIMRRLPLVPRDCSLRRR